MLTERQDDVEKLRHSDDVMKTFHVTGKILNLVMTIPNLIVIGLQMMEFQSMGGFHLPRSSKILKSPDLLGLQINTGGSNSDDSFITVEIYQEIAHSSQ